MRVLIEGNRRKELSEKSNYSKINQVAKDQASEEENWMEQADYIRLNKYLAECGICSRREADRLIESGKVLVNGTKAAMGTKVSEADTVMVDGTPVSGKKEKVVLAYYKPLGVICTEKDKYAKHIVTEELNYPVRVTYAGRLDKDSEGLLLMTNDGELIDNLMRGRNAHEKEYQVRVEQELTKEFLEDMKRGVYLKELEETTRPCNIEQTGKWDFRIVITQGLNRQIRRMCDAFGYEVRALKRIRIANITIGNLKPGEYRVVEGDELQELYREAGMQ